jgi:replicative DNA helicase
MPRSCASAPSCASSSPASDEIATNAFNPQGRQVSQILDEAEGKIFKIGEEGSRSKQGFIGMDKLVVQLIDRVTELAENGAEDVTGVRTGFYDLDRMTAGLQKGDLIILAARPSMGKTAFALNIAEHVAVNEGLPVAGVLDGNGRLAAGAADGRLARPHRPAAACAPAGCATTNGAA